MRKKLFALPMALGLAIVVASCSKAKPVSTEQTTTTLKKTGTYTIRVYDFDNELLGEETLNIEDYPVFKDGLKAKFNVVSYDSQYGTSIVSINGSMVDSNWYMASTENGEYCQTGVDGLVVDDKDVFEFRNTCWNVYPSEYGKHLDEYDLLVDNVIYSYAKTKLQDRISKYESATFIPYDLLAIDMMKENQYDTNLFNANGLAEAYKTDIKNKDVTTLAGQDIARWYYGARTTGENLDQFKTVYSAYLEGVTSYGSYAEYTLPFTLTFAKRLGLDDKISDDVKNTTYRAGTELGCDGLSWQYVGLAEYKTIEESELRANLTLDNIQSEMLTHAQEGTSLAITLMAYAAANIDVRKEDFFDNKDAIEYLFDNYFDKETYQFEIEKTPDDISSSQIYAALVAYKIQRDKQKAVNIFA